MNAYGKWYFCMFTKRSGIQELRSLQFFFSNFIWLLVRITPFRRGHFSIAAQKVQLCNEKQKEKITESTQSRKRVNSESAAKRRKLSFRTKYTGISQIRNRNQQEKRKEEENAKTKIWWISDAFFFISYWCPN